MFELFSPHVTQTQCQISAPVNLHRTNSCSPGPMSSTTDHTVKGAMTLAFVEACHQAKIPRLNKPNSDPSQDGCCGQDVSMGETQAVCPVSAVSSKLISFDLAMGLLLASSRAPGPENAAPGCPGIMQMTNFHPIVSLTLGSIN